MSPGSDPYSGLTFAITGGTGFLGRRIADLIDSRGGLVRTIALGDSEEAIPDIVADLTEEDATRTAITGADYVIHLAARSGGIGFQAAADWSVWMDNTTATSLVLQAAVESHVRGVFLASSAVVYQSRTDSPIPEEWPLITGADRESPYAWSKVCDEATGRWFHRAHGLPVRIGRFSTIFGPRGTAHRPGATVIEDLIHRARSLEIGQPLVVWGDGHQVRSYIHVDDAAAAVLAILIEGEAGSAYNVDTGVPTTISELARLILDRVSPDTAISFDKSKPTGTPYRVLDPGRLRALGWSPKNDLESGIAETVA